MNSTFFRLTKFRLELKIRKRNAWIKLTLSYVKVTSNVCNDSELAERENKKVLIKNEEIISN